MKIGILQTGHPPDELRERYGDYAAMFRRLLDGQGFEFAAYPVLDGVFPARVDEADGWLITGSRFGVYEPLPWIAPLEALLREAFDRAVPIVGICFGHQLLAQALGGKVEKFAGGWTVGLERYTLEGFDDGACVVAWHQDQVVELPDVAPLEVIGSTPTCRYAALVYGERALTLQPHPEFTAQFAADLLVARGAVLPPEVAARARVGLDGANAAAEVAGLIARFYRGEHGPAPERLDSLASPCA